MVLAPSSPTPARLVAKGARTIREARLLPVAAHLYSWVEAGRWQPAALLADQVLAGHLLRGRHTVTCRRVLHEAHFEFRGGSSPADTRQAGGPRREDREGIGS